MSEELKSDEIEQIVREVIARLGNDAKPSKLPVPAQPLDNPAEPSHASLHVASRVVTLADLEGRLNDVKQVVVPHRAIVTPAVRDRLKDQRIELLWSVKQPPTAGGSSPPLVVAIAARRFDATALLAAARVAGRQVARLASADLRLVVEELTVEVVREGKAGVLVTDEAPLALCLAHRRRGVRALWAVDRRRLTADLAAIGANLLVIDPAGKSGYEMQRLVLEFARQTWLAPPGLE